MNDKEKANETGMELRQNTPNGLSGFLGAEGLGEWYSFDAKTKEGAALLIKAQLDELPSLKSKANETIEISNFYAHEVETISEQGELERWTRIVLFGPDGQGYSCGSIGVRKCLAILLHIRGTMPWNPPVKCKVKLRQLEGKKQFLTLEPDLDGLLGGAQYPGKKK